ncbi:MAG: MarR family transcriptional regulator [Oscillospiraceae bacterium]|nr:MarR family transcriptional regulator [Oscillospiraceae bacterium]
MSASISRISGLCQLWAQKNGVLYGVVQVLYILRFKGTVTQKRISECCEIPKQTVNNVIKQLKEDGFIEFETRGGDKRQKLIRLTALGEDYAARTLEPFFRLNQKVYERIGLDPIRRLESDLNDLGDAIELETRILELDGEWENRDRKGDLGSARTT